MAGKIIAGMGLPGAGKSTVFAALAEVLVQKGMAVVLRREPEEPQWPAAVTERDTSGHITALTWFRSQRVPGLFQAAAARNRGDIGLVDSYYDKLIHLYFEKPGLEWLMKPDDPYRDAYRELIAIDHDRLPDADCVVSLTVELERWRELVRGRGRELDRKANLLETFETQAAFLQATEDYCRNKNIPCILFENKFATPLAAAIALHDQLITAGILT
jgi:thymidylate kinase